MKTIPLEQPAYPPPSTPLIARPPGNVRYAVIHHTGGAIDESPLAIDEFERRNFIGGPYAMIPYERLIYPNRIVAGRPLDDESGATFGENADSVALCCVGNYELNEPSDTLIKTLIIALVNIHLLIPSIIDTHGHCDVDATACPGKFLYDRIPYIKSEVYRRLYTE